MRSNAVAPTPPEAMGPMPGPVEKESRIRVLHLSDTTLSGSPIRIAQVTNKYSSKYVARHLSWTRKIGYRSFCTDLVGEEMKDIDLKGWLDWADIIHYHNRWARQDIFAKLGITPPNKPSVIQMHSPRQSENFSPEVDSGLPIIVVGQYQPRQWPEAAYIVPNLIDIWDPNYMPIPNKAVRPKPIVSYAPSNTNASGWDNKGYNLVAPHLKRLKLSGQIMFQLIIDKPHDIVLAMKQSADIGIDEIATGSYHLSSLEYLSMGVPCFANIDGKTQDVLMRMTGATTLPWIIAARDTFPIKLNTVMANRNWLSLGKEARLWMETYWQPSVMIKQYEEIYAGLS